MRVKSVKVFVHVLLFGLLLGVSSTTYADALAISSISFSNLTFTPTSGTALLTPSGASARSRAQNSLGETQDVIVNMVPLARATATVTFASSTSTTSTTNTSVEGASLANVSGCICSADTFSVSLFTGTLVILGGEGNVDVTLSGFLEAMGQVVTDQFGLFAEAETLFDISVNGISVFSNDMLIRVNGPNQTGNFQLVGHQLSRVITLQFGAVNTIGIRAISNAVGATEGIPEPATIVLLVSGLGFMTGVLKKRRKKANE